MKSVSRTKSFEAAAPAAEVFPLFSPEGEKKWAPGWDYDSPLGPAPLAEDYVFLTESHDHAEAAAIWLVKRYEPERHFIQFYRIEPQVKVGVITIRCAALDPDRTEVWVTYKYLALSPAGEDFIAGFSQAAYDEFIGQWRRLLAAYLQTAA